MNQMGEFIGALANHKDGEAAAIINAKFAELREAVLSTNGKGSITVTIDMKPGKIVDGSVDQMETEIKWKVNKPEAAAGKGIFFVHPITRQLQREKPNLQRELDLEGSR